MLTRSLDEIIAATSRLPDHLVAVRRFYGHSPQAVRALRALQDALLEVDAALLGRHARPPLGEDVADTGEAANGAAHRD